MSSFLLDVVAGGFVGWFLRDIIVLYRRGFSRGFDTWSRDEWALWGIWSLAATYCLVVLFNVLDVLLQ